MNVAPGFFGNRTPDDGFQYGDNLLISATGNVMLRPLKAGTWAGVSPYAAAGVGLFHTRIADANEAFDASGNQLAFDAGGGVTRAIAGRLRLQADARYFRTLQGRQPKDELDLAIDSLSFWRFVAGIGYRF
jgi:opacity protein-like surface antigen